MTRKRSGQNSHVVGCPWIGYPVSVDSVANAFGDEAKLSEWAKKKDALMDDSS